MRILTGFVVLAFVGCTGDLVELTPGGNKADMSASGGGGGGGGGGGQGTDEMGVNASKFFPDIQSDIDALTCSLGACHGGTQVPVLKPNATAGSGDANYTN